jgi:lipoprotein signal peptidase
MGAQRETGAQVTSSAPDGNSVEANRLRACGLGTLAVLALDQFAKAAAPQIDSPAIVDAHNSEYAFGVAGGPPVLLVAGALVVLAVFLMVIGRWAIQIGVPPIVPALVAGGMLGNVFDRVVLGGVRDFLVTPWAICNLADLAIVSGILALGLSFALRMIQLRLSASTIQLARPGLRAVIVRRR